MSDEPELLDLVDQLTKKSSVASWQHQHVHTWINVAGPDEDPEYICEWEAAHKNDVSAELKKRINLPLLEQLRRAVTSSVGGAGGGSKAARERTPLDVIAFTLLEHIDGQVRAWLQEAGDPSTGDLISLVRNWYTVFTRYKREPAESDRYFKIVARWVVSITDLIDPPTRQEITAPCPICGQTWVERGHGGDTESLRALWALWRSNPEDSAAHCEGCGKTWQGVSQMRSLRIAIDDAEKLSETA